MVGMNYKCLKQLMDGCIYIVKRENESVCMCVRVDVCVREWYRP